MRILMINRSLPVHVPGGLEHHVHDLALGLAEAGCQIHLLCGPVPQPTRAVYESRGITLHKAEFAKPWRYSLKYLARVSGKIADVLAHYSIDLIHAHEYALGFWNPPPGAPPLVLSVHGTITSETPLHADVYKTLGPSARLRAWLHYGRRYLYSPFWRRALKRAQRILVDSAFTRCELSHLVPEVMEKVYCVPLGLREADLGAPTQVEARRRLGWTGIQFLTTGRLEWSKGHEIALEALATLRHYDWHYTIVGAGKYRKIIEKKIKRLGLYERVSLAGWVDESIKRLMLAAADLFLWPERTHPAFGLAGLEAQLASTPVLATRRGAIPEVLGTRGGWLVADLTPESIAAELERLLANQECLQVARIGLRQDAIARFSFDSMIRHALEQYRITIASIHGRTGPYSGRPNNITRPS